MAFRTPRLVPRALRSRGLFRVLLCLAILIPWSTLRAGAKDPTWIFTMGTANTLGRFEPLAVKEVLASGTTIQLGAGQAQSWASEQAFADDLEANAIPSEVSYVMYDPENWAQTPLPEREYPVLAMAQFAHLAHAAGYHVILTPHPNLTTVEGASCHEGPGQTQDQAFLSCGIAAGAARALLPGDIVDLQFQSLETSPSLYHSAVSQGVRQIESVENHVTVVAELSSHYASRATEMTAAWRSVRGLVSGFYLAVPGGEHAQIASLFLATAVSAVPR
jgi:hypothetical protein